MKVQITGVIDYKKSEVEETIERILKEKHIARPENFPPKFDQEVFSPHNGTVVERVLDHGATKVEYQRWFKEETSEPYDNSKEGYFMPLDEFIKNMNDPKKCWECVSLSYSDRKINDNVDIYFWDSGKLKEVRVEEFSEDLISFLCKSFGVEIISFNDFVKEKECICDKDCAYLSYLSGLVSNSISEHGMTSEEVMQKFMDYFFSE